MEKKKKLCSSDLHNRPPFAGCGHLDSHGLGEQGISAGL